MSIPSLSVREPSDRLPTGLQDWVSKQENDARDRAQREVGRELGREVVTILKFFNHI
jgi:hypothetical protein